MFEFFIIITNISNGCECWWVKRYWWGPGYIRFLKNYFLIRADNEVENWKSDSYRNWETVRISGRVMRTSLLPYIRSTFIFDITRYSDQLIFELFWKMPNLKIEGTENCVRTGAFWSLNLWWLLRIMNTRYKMLHFRDYLTTISVTFQIQKIIQVIRVEQNFVKDNFSSSPSPAIIHIHVKILKK